MQHLPSKEAQLLALIYYEDCSIREAGRQLGWRKSAADRHHAAAMAKMLALIGDPKLLSGAMIGPAASAYVHGDAHHRIDSATQVAFRTLSHAYAAASERVEVVAHRSADLARRVAPFSDSANVAATGGAARVAAHCGAAASIAVCGLLAAPAVEQGLEALGRSHPARSPARHAKPQRAASRDRAPDPHRPRRQPRRRQLRHPRPLRNATASNGANDAPAPPARPLAERAPERKRVR